MMAINEGFAVLIYALTVLLEARGEGVDGMEHVTDVIYNRCVIEQTKYPEKPTSSVVKGVLFKPYQFSCWNGVNDIKDIGRLLSGLDDNIKPYIWRMIEFRYKALDCGTTIVPVTEATHYHAIQVHPRWSLSSEMRPIGRLGNHMFYVEKYKS